MEHLSLKQLNFYPPETKFFIKLKNFESGEIKVLKDISISEYKEKYLNYCKHLNAQGYNVFLSPPPYLRGCDILLDDVSIETVKRLAADGFEPLYYLETSSSNFQAIIRLSDNSIDRDIQKFISKQLADIYNSDKNSADPGHFFRLAGFTNRKQKYCKNGLFPFVKLFSADRKTASKGQEYIDNIEKGITAGFIELPGRNIRTTPEGQRRGERKTENNNTGCYEYIRKVYSSNSLIDDISIIDFRAARYAVKKGFKIDDIANAIRQLSPDLETRKSGHIQDYILRTIRNAAARL